MCLITLVLDSDSETSCLAEDFRKRLSCMDFIVPLLVLARITDIFKAVSQQLQENSICLVKSCDEVLTCRNIVAEMAADEEREQFKNLFAKATFFANSFDIPITRRGYRLDAPVQEIQDWYYLNIFKPFFVSIINEIDARFSEHFVRAAKASMLVPAFMYGEDFNPDGFDELLDFYQDDLIDLKPAILSEIERWHHKFQGMSIFDQPSSIQETILHADPRYFRNVRVLLQILWTLPVSTASVERGFSRLKMSKTYLRNTCGEDRLNGLVLLNTHRDIDVPTEFIVDRFLHSKARR